MELSEAKNIVTALINGIDPTTGEVLPEGSPYNNPQVIRALFTVLDTLKVKKQPKKTLEEKQQDNIKAGRPKNAGISWDDELKALLASTFQSGASIDELATNFERTKGAIVSELTKQGLIEPKTDNKIS
ncbi:hypothetical protein V6M93_01160 [Pectobacterium brasiliense]|uniref:hypothetical protein n=1 Tax=Pectobacterium brasiliense TaxID=180957 RepID=UPI0005806C85|nr:hypothetical protein [Pectobacterium brasiliense]GKV77385.1 hypothetical protein PEC106568_25590 [Pectobacterium carotovorum subsp. carotovorum]ATV42305.1 hypothetical protein CTV95_02045 [Pectobacterium brasiliense]KHS88684.1 hypothetical protein RC86_16930 [Pectobacterium brasiliense]MBN3198308.1 hypothetical protein [Pectobacterium brasiliense]MBN3207283.1 hypothetical protein [Pectobacterium brasiliense]